MTMQTLTLFLIIAAIIALALVLAKLAKVEQSLAAVHILVNSRLAVALDEKERLERQVELFGGPKAPPPRGPDDK